MVAQDVTCWTLIRRAAEGNAADRSLFCERYLPLVRRYLSVRWEPSPLSADVDDAVQEVFLECLREDGVIAKADPDRPGGFRRFLLGVVRNVAGRVEQRAARRFARQEPGGVDPSTFPSDDDRPSQAFDRDWARSIMEQAADLQRERARKTGGDPLRRVELLELRFQDGLPIRAIAEQWEVAPERLHRDYRKARLEFRDCLLGVLRYHDPAGGRNLETECARLLEALD